MIVAPGYRPSKPQSGGGASGPVVERVFPYVHKLTSSVSLGAADFRTLLDDNGISNSFNELYIEVLAVGGGGSGVSYFEYDNGLYGGFPGSFVIKKMPFRDFLKDDTCVVMVEVGSGGAGGEYAAMGGDTYVACYDANFSYYADLRATGGLAGIPGYDLSNSNAQNVAVPERPIVLRKANYEFSRLLGFSGIDLSAFVRFPEHYFEPGSVNGPAQGGAIFPRQQFDPWGNEPDVGTWPKLISGGNSAFLDSTRRRNGGGISFMEYYTEGDPIDGQDGWLASADFDDFGAGGAAGFYHPGTYPGGSDPIASPKRGGHGGFPGGGGGPCAFIGNETAYQAAMASAEPPTGGNGGNGAVAFRFSVLEAV